LTAWFADRAKPLKARFRHLRRAATFSAGFDGKILSLYARGMSVREIQRHQEEIYGTGASPSLISSVTDAFAEEVKAWQVRHLDPLYPLIWTASTSRCGKVPCV